MAFRSIDDRRTSRRLSRTSSAGALALALAAIAAPSAAQVLASGVRGPEAASSTEQSDGTEIVVTGSRLGRKDVPTPMLEISAADLQVAARPNVVAALNDLPQFRATVSGQTSGGNTNAGAAIIDLRGLGVIRTLPLLDGRRLVADVTAPDLSIIPGVLIKRVDVVTGGASAAWGSNAVAGVVNFAVDETFSGVKLGGRYGISDRDDVEERAFEGAFGTAFAGGRGHFVIGAEYADNKGGRPRSSRPNVGRWAPINNVLTPDVGNALVAPGGLIQNGINVGRAFNPGGTISPFNRGTIVGSNGVGGDAPSNDDVVPVYAPSERYNVLARATFDVTERLTLKADILHARVAGNYHAFSNASTDTIRADNAFLPAAIRTQMQAANETSFTLGRFNADYGILDIDYARKTTQATVQLDSEVGTNLHLSGYYTHGIYDDNVNLKNQRITANYLSAVDAVISPTTGLPVCRASLTNPTLNCTPINLFGEGATSQAARDYVLGDGQQRNRSKLDAGGVTLRGEPFDLWAGPVSIAIGAEIRRDSIRAQNGRLDRNASLNLLNFPRFNGHNVTKEGFAEVQLPILRDLPLLQQLQLNGAARLIHDQSGSIWAWKVGLIDEVTSGVRARFTRSKDVRSANVNELFRTRIGPNTLRVTDPVTNSSPIIFLFTGGNPNLDPEYALTTTAGVSIAPRSIPSLTFSVDYFDINVKNAISSLAAQNVINGCAAGNQGLCAAITRDGSNTITTIDAALQNFQSFKTRGFDFAAGYTLPIELPGSLAVRGNLAWVTKYAQNTGLTTVNFLGSQGSAAVGQFGVPRVRANLGLFYDSDKLHFDARARYLSSGYISRLLTVTNNRIPAYVYIDIGARVNVLGNQDKGLELFGNINNLFDKAPPPMSTQAPYYDVIGRYFVAGVRARF